MSNLVVAPIFLWEYFLIRAIQGAYCGVVRVEKKKKVFTFPPHSKSSKQVLLYVFDENGTFKFVIKKLEF